MNRIIDVLAVQKRIHREKGYILLKKQESGIFDPGLKLNP